MARYFALLLCTAVFAQDLRKDIDYVREKVYPALVNISVVGEAFGGGKRQKFRALGSGTIVSPAGHVLTNYHVVGHTTRRICTLPTGEEIPADVVAHDPLTDLSILKLDLSARKDRNAPLPFATLGRSADLQVGDYVLAIGNPLGLSSSLTLGVVSNTERLLGEGGELDFGDGEITGIFTRWIQHDALILPGNSGGPLVNLRGEIVGVNTRGGSGFGLANPSDLAAKIINQVLAHGEVVRGWLGASVVPSPGVDGKTGGLVSMVIDGSPAHKAGLKPGDILLTLDGKEVSCLREEDVPVFLQQVAELAVGKKVKATLLRGDSPLSVEITATKMAPFLGDEHEFKLWGATAREITAPMALIRRYPDTRGVVVTGMRPGFPLDKAKPKIQAGDILVSVGGESVENAASLESLVEKFKSEKEVIVGVRRGNAHVLCAVENPEENKDKPKGGELPKAWLGIETQVLTPAVAKVLGVDGQRGFRVTRVFAETEAAKAGIQVGDLVVSIDGEKLSAFRLQDAEDLKREIENLPIGGKAKFGLLRGQAKLDVDVVLEKNPEMGAKPETYENKALGFTVRSLTWSDRIAEDDPKLRGVVVADVETGNWAQLGDLRFGDRILAIDQFEIRDTADVQAALDILSSEKPESMAFFVKRGYRTHYVFLEPDWSEVGEK